MVKSKMDLIFLLVLPMLFSPVLVFLYKKTFNIGKISLPKDLVSGKISSIEINKDGILVFKTKEGNFIGISYIELGEEFFELKEYTPESLLARSYLLGRILSGITAEAEFRIVRKNIDTAKLSEKIEKELDSLRALMETQPENQRLKEREKRLLKIYERISEGEKIGWLTSYIVLRTKGNEREHVEKILLQETNELVRALKIMLGINSRITTRKELRRILEAALFLTPQTNTPYLGGEKESFSTVPIPPYERSTLDPKGVFIGYRRGTKIPFLYNLTLYGTRHVLVVGPTGKGKTTLLATIINRVYARGQTNMVIIDPKGDLNSMVSSSITRVRFSSKTIVEKKLVENILAHLLHETSNNSYLNGKTRFSLQQLEENLGIRLVFADPPGNEEIPLEKILNTRTVLIVLDNLTDDGRFLMVAVLMRILLEQLYNEEPTKRLKKLIVIDEAWRSSESSLYYTKRLIKESRGFGAGLILSTQSLKDIPSEVLHNFGTIMAFGSSDSGYIQDILSLTGFNVKDVAKELPLLGVGEIIVKLPESIHPAFVEVDPDSTPK